VGFRFIDGRAILSVVMALVIFAGSLLVVVLSQSVQGVYLGFFDELGSPLSGVNFLVQVWAVDPESVPSTVDVYRGWVYGNGLFISADNPAFKKVLEAWIRLHPGDYNYETFLGVFAWAIVDGKVLTYPLIIVNYNPLMALRGIIRRDITLNIRSYTDDGVKPKWISEIKSINPANGYGRFWMRDENLSWETGNYIQVPILIVHNNGSISGVLSASINIDIQYRFGCRSTIGYGVEIRKKFFNGTVNIPLELRIDSITIIGPYTFSASALILPNEKRYIWIGAKVAHIHWREYEYRPPPEEPPTVPTGNEMLQSYVYAFQANGVYIAGGVGEGAPPYEDIIFVGTNKTQLVIPDTVLSDGDLDVGENIMLQQIINWSDIYNVDLEVPIPVGAIAAAALSVKIPGIAGPIISTLSGIGVTIGYVDVGNARVTGNLLNEGKRGNNGYNVPEIVYYRISKYLYKAGPGRFFRVPVGIYFICV